MARREWASRDQSGELPKTLEEQPYAHTLSLRLTAEQYRRLRRFVIGHEARTGHRLTHQAVLEAALVDFLAKQNP